MSMSSLKRPAVIVAALVLSVSAVTFGFGLKAAGVYLRKLPIYPEGARPVQKIPAESANWKAVGPDRREKQEWHGRGYDFAAGCAHRVLHGAD
jgi:hypothetical protein